MPFLIVDPVTNRQRQLRTVLTSLGYRAAEIESVTDLNTALLAIRSKRFGCCFVAMSHLGTEASSFLQELKDQSGCQSLPIVAYGPGATREDVLMAVQAGASSFFSCPFVASDIEAVLSQQLKV